MGWRPSDRCGVVLAALARSSRPVSASRIAFVIDTDDELRRWWKELPTPGQRPRPIALSSQNVQARLYTLMERVAVMSIDGVNPEHGWREPQYKIVNKEDREALRLRTAAKLAIPVKLERAALKTAESLGLGVEFVVASEGRRFQAVVRVGSKRGTTEHRAHLYTVLGSRRVEKHEDLVIAWREALADAGLV